MEIIEQDKKEYIFRQRKELAKIEAERDEQLQLKTSELKRTNKKSLLYTMEEIIYEEEESASRNTKEIETDDEIEEEIDDFPKESCEDQSKELSESSDIPEEVSEELEEEIPEAIECEEDSDKHVLKRTS